MTTSNSIETSSAIPRLAIIDDAEFDQMLYQRVIKRTGLVGETLCFFSAEEALHYFDNAEAQPVDVVLLDINMPGMSGFDFLEHAGSGSLPELADIVVVMLTTSLDPSDVERARKFNLVKDYINKPLEEAHLKRISELLVAVRAGSFNETDSFLSNQTKH